MSPALGRGLFRARTSLCKDSGPGWTFWHYSGVTDFHPDHHDAPAPEGWRVYHRDDSGSPDMHTDGTWYYEPGDWDTGEVYSAGYATRGEALSACQADADQLAWEASVESGVSL